MDKNAFKGSPRTLDPGQMVPRASNSQTDDKQKAQDQEAWFVAILNYTSRKLTKQSDILHALAGMARAVQSRTHDRYLAGLWRSSLTQCLCWISNWSAAQGGLFDPKNPAPIFHHRRSEYLAPSWSWASINGQVSYESWIFNALDPTPTPRALSLMPRILEATTLPAGLDEFGSCREGWIRLVGKARPGFTRGEGLARQTREGVYDVIEGTITEIGMIKYDVPSEAPAGELKAIACLCMLPRAERFGDSVGLVLTPVAGQKDTYRRVGLCSLIKLEWFEQGAEAEMVIV